MKVLRRVTSKISLFSRLRAFPAYMVDPSVGMPKKGAVILGLIYGLWPLDAFPDAIPVAGWLDDLGVLWLLYLFMMRELGQYIRRRRHRA